jgi:hypothetical protein
MMMQPRVQRVGAAKSHTQHTMRKAAISPTTTKGRSMRWCRFGLFCCWILRSLEQKKTHKLLSHPQQQPEGNSFATRPPTQCSLSRVPINARCHACLLMLVVTRASQCSLSRVPLNVREQKERGHQVAMCQDRGHLVDSYAVIVRHSHMKCLQKGI